MIETARLTLIPFDLDHARALQTGVSKLESMLRVALPEGWPHFPEAYAVERLGGSMEEDASPSVWGTYLFLLSDRSALVGSGGYKGKPRSGIIEVGYEIAPGYQNRGFATEATHGMIDYAFSRPDVRFVQAHTLAGKSPSTRVLEKLGMTFVEEAEDPEEGAVWRWLVAKEAWATGP